MQWEPKLGNIWKIYKRITTPKSSFAKKRAWDNTRIKLASTSENQHNSLHHVLCLIQLAPSSWRYWEYQIRLLMKGGRKTEIAKGKWVKTRRLATREWAEPEEWGGWDSDWLWCWWAWPSGCGLLLPGTAGWGRSGRSDCPRRRRCSAAASAELTAAAAAAAPYPSECRRTSPPWGRSIPIHRQTDRQRKREFRANERKEGNSREGKKGKAR